MPPSYEERPYWELLYSPKIPLFRKSTTKLWTLFEIAVKPKIKYSDYELYLRSKIKTPAYKFSQPHHGILLDILRDIERKKNRKNDKETSKLDRNTETRNNQFFIINPIKPSNSEIGFHLYSINNACKDLVTHKLILNTKILPPRKNQKNEYIITKKGFYTLVYLLAQNFVEQEKQENSTKRHMKYETAMDFIASYWYLWEIHGEISDEARLIYKISEGISNYQGIQFSFIIEDIFVSFLDACIKYCPKFLFTTDLSQNTKIDAEIWELFFSRTIESIISCQYGLEDYGHLYGDESDENNRGPIIQLIKIIKNEINRNSDNIQIFSKLHSKTEQMMNNLDFFRYN